MIYLHRIARKMFVVLQADVPAGQARNIVKGLEHVTTSSSMAPAAGQLLPLTRERRCTSLPRRASRRPLATPCSSHSASPPPSWMPTPTRGRPGPRHRGRGPAPGRLSTTHSPSKRFRPVSGGPDAVGGPKEGQLGSAGPVTRTLVTRFPPRVRWDERRS